MTTPILDKVIITEERGRYVVSPHWQGVDRPCSFAISCGHNCKLATRLQKAMMDGAAFRSPEIRVDVHGKTYVDEHCRVMGRYLNADLKRLGY